jgi:putative alpha-1,2-mannosidase
MSSWFLFQSMGFYPNAGQDIYLIGTPSYPEADIEVGPGKVFRVIADGLDAEHINRYVQSATLNGEPLNASWFRHSQIKNGGTLHLRMGSAPTKWGADNPPPSMSDATAPLCPAALLH